MYYRKQVCAFYNLFWFVVKQAFDKIHFKRFLDGHVLSFLAASIQSQF